MAASVGTWKFSFPAVQIAKEKLLKSESALEAAECAVAFVEDDIEMGRNTVGRGGMPNSSGFLQCDAAIMDGKDLSFGAVAALEGIATPIKVAARVLKKSRHSFIVGAGAQKFAIEQGFTLEPLENLLTSEYLKVEIGSAQLSSVLLAVEFVSIMRTLNDLIGTDQPHDTLGLITLDRFQSIAAGVSTSGLPQKFPGRVGDSPLPGCGLYADNLTGAACATGDGDDILKFCPCFHAVQLMKQGATPADACRQVVLDIRRRIGARDAFEIGIIAMNMQGSHGAAYTHSTVKSFSDMETNPGFPYCVWNEGEENPTILYSQAIL